MTNGQHGGAWYPQNTMSKASTRRRYTVEDWLAVADEQPPYELIDGELIQKDGPGIETSPAVSHGATILWVGIALAPFVRRPGDADRPDGWWLATDAGIQLGSFIFRPDIVGWRCDRHPAMPRARPAPERPDWVCEVLSESNRRQDTVVKLHQYHQAGIPYYWIIDGDAGTLAVHRHTPDGYLIALCATASDHVRAEPFGAIELDLAALLGDVSPPAAPGPRP